MMVTALPAARQLMGNLQLSGVVLGGPPGACHVLSSDPQFERERRSLRFSEPRTQSASWSARGNWDDAG